MIALTDGTPIDDPEVIANAEFIVLACNCHDDLLEALKEMDALVESLWDSVAWGKTFNLDVSALNLAPSKAKAAIAKAEGA